MDHDDPNLGSKYWLLRAIARALLCCGRFAWGLVSFSAKTILGMLVGGVFTIAVAHAIGWAGCGQTNALTVWASAETFACELGTRLIAVGGAEASGPFPRSDRVWPYELGQRIAQKLFEDHRWRLNVSDRLTQSAQRATNFCPDRPFSKGAPDGGIVILRRKMTYPAKLKAITLVAGASLPADPESVAYVTTMVSDLSRMGFRHIGVWSDKCGDVRIDIVVFGRDDATPSWILDVLNTAERKVAQGARN